MKINQQYIADILKVSRVTVTKALQDHTDIAEETRRKVKELAEQLGYIPNGIGRSLSTKKTQTIGIIVPKINHSFFSSVIEDMFKAATVLDYKILLMVSFESEAIEYSSVKTLLSMNVDGIIIDTASDTTTSRSYSLIKKHSKPFLFFDRKLRNFDAPGVFFDDEELSCKLVKAVINKGYRRIMYITGPQHLNINYDRLQGFKRAMSESNLEVPNDLIIETNLGQKNGYKAFQLYLQTHKELPEAICCVNDSIALGVYDACKEAGISIPDDLGVVGYGNVAISSLVQPALTTVEIRARDACFKAVEVLVKMIESGIRLVPDSLFSGDIVIRGSIRS